jgi:hypothetical protein
MTHRPRTLPLAIVSLGRFVSLLATNALRTMKSIKSDQMCHGGRSGDPSSRRGDVISWVRRDSGKTFALGPPTQMSSAMTILERATSTAVEEIPSFDRLHAIDDCVAVQEIPITRRTQKPGSRWIGRCDHRGLRKRKKG